MLNSTLILSGFILCAVLTITNIVVSCVTEKQKECLSIFKGETDTAVYLSDIRVIRVKVDCFVIWITYPTGTCKLSFHSKEGAERMLAEITCAKNRGDKCANIFFDDFRRDAQAKEVE